MNAIRDFMTSTDGASVVVEYNGVVVGLICCISLTKGLDRLPDPGKAAQQCKIASLRFRNELVSKYGKVMWISLFVVCDADRRGDFEDMVMQYIINEAKKANMNLALIADKGMGYWSNKWKFKESHSAGEIAGGMRMGGTDPIICRFMLELFPAAGAQQ